jgi:hypothetical protein
MPWVSKRAEKPYVELVERALTRPLLFNSFKQQVPWFTVVGRIDPWHGIQCAKSLSEFPEVKANLPKFALNDSLGSPATVRVWGNQYGIDTLRFAESVSYLFKTFGDLNGKRIVELGSNYGGLAFCILQQWPNVAAYHCLDLEPIQTFQRAYLSKLGVESSAIQYTEPETAPDLFISEYTLSEFTDDDLYPLWERYGVNAGACLLRINFSKGEREAAFLNKVRENFQIEVTAEPAIREPNKIVVCWR